MSTRTVPVGGPGRTVVIMACAVLAFGAGIAAAGALEDAPVTFRSLFAASVTVAALTLINEIRLARRLAAMQDENVAAVRAAVRPVEIELGRMRRLERERLAALMRAASEERPISREQYWRIYTDAVGDLAGINSGDISGEHPRL